MPKNKDLYLYRVLEVQKVVLKYQPRGYTMKRIYEDYIRNQYFIGRTTFYNYLNVNTFLERTKTKKTITTMIA
jgi:hypothetical protein